MDVRAVGQGDGYLLHSLLPSESAVLSVSDERVLVRAFAVGLP
jgi:hypothetical protein